MGGKNVALFGLTSLKWMCHKRLCVASLNQQHSKEALPHLTTFQTELPACLLEALLMFALTSASERRCQSSSEENGLGQPSGPSPAQHGRETRAEAALHLRVRESGPGGFFVSGGR